MKTEKGGVFFLWLKEAAGSLRKLDEGVRFGFLSRSGLGKLRREEESRGSWG